MLCLILLIQECQSYCLFRTWYTYRRTVFFKVTTRIHAALFFPKKRKGIEIHFHTNVKKSARTFGWTGML
jgi:hypothetical protein